MTNMQQRNNIAQYSALYTFIKEHCIFDGSFILSSGKRTQRYFDLRILTLNGQLSHLIAHAVGFELKKHGIQISDFDCIGGMESGAIPLISILSTVWGKYGFYVRKKPRDHGLYRNIEGWALHKNLEYLLVDDVVTTGMTMVKVQELLDKKRPVAMICIVDRMIEQPLGLISLFKETDFLLE